MSWKDFFYYRNIEKAAILILMTLILIAVIMSLITTIKGSREVTVAQNEAFMREFEEFQASLEEVKGEDKNTTSKKHTTTGHYPKNRSPKQSFQSEKNSSYVAFQKQEKLAEGEQISLNSTDTTEWKKIPGIGSSYAARIVKYRTLLGGFAAIEQLREVYGMDSDLYEKIAVYVKPDGNYQRIAVNKLEFKQLLKHPYLNYKQVKAIMDLRHRKGSIRSIEELTFLDEFSSGDIERLRLYLLFE